MHSAQKWVRVVREGIEAHSFKDSEEKEERGEVAVSLIPVRLLFMQLLERI